MSHTNAPRKVRPSGGMSSAVLRQNHERMNDSFLSNMDNSTTSEFSTECYFVCTGQWKTDKEKFHKEVYKLCGNAGIDPRLISLDDALKIGSNDTNFFVLHEFEGLVFEHLKKNKNKVISSFLVRECLRQERALVKLNLPVYSLHLEGAKVCFTGFVPVERQNLTDLVFALGGLVSKQFSESCTHLVADKYDASSKKYRAAVQLSRPIMDRSWIDSAWTLATSHSPHNCVNEEFINTHKMKLLKGTLITKTGVDQQQLINVIRLIDLHGGKYDSSLSRVCTHMLTEGTSGEKYRKARQWGNVRIVDLKWLYKSIEAGYVLREDRFDPERHRCSTPTPGGMQPQDLEISAITGPNSRRFSTQNDMSFNVGGEQMDIDARTPGSITRPSVSSRSHISSTIMNTPSNKSAANYLGDQNDRVSTLRRENSTRQLNDSGNRSITLRREPSRSRLLEVPQVMIARKLKELDDPIDEVPDNILRGSYDHLEGCRVMLIGASEDRIDRWKRLFNCLGATRVNKATVDTLMIIVRVRGSEDENALQSGRDVGAVLLHAKWAIQCLSENEHLSTDAYTWDSFLSKLEDADVFNREQPRTSLELGMTTTNGQNEKEFDHRSRATVCAADLIPADNDENKKAQLDANASVLTLLGGAKVKVRSDQMDSNELEQWIDLINGSGGVVVDDPALRADYLLCPMVEFSAVPAPNEVNVDHIVSIYWLRHSVHTGIVQVPSANPLFRPIPACAGSTVFKDCVVGFSSLLPHLRDTLTELVTQFGGLVQNAIHKQTFGDNKRNTHVVSGQETKKTETSRQWGINVVDASWILECVINDKKMKEDQFIFKGSAFASYCGRSDDLWVSDEKKQLQGDEDVFHSEQTTALREDFEEERRNNDYSMVDVNSMSIVADDPLDIVANTAPTTDCSTPFVRMDLQRHASTPVNVRLKALRTQTTNPQPHENAGVDTPSKFLDPSKAYRPRFNLDGVTQVIENIPSPPQHNTTDDSLSTSAIGRILHNAAEKTARMTIHTPVQKRNTDAFPTDTSIASEARHRTDSHSYEMNAIPESVTRVANPLPSEMALSIDNYVDKEMEEQRREFQRMVQERITKREEEEIQAPIAAVASPQKNPMKTRRKRVRESGGSPDAKRSTQTTITIHDVPLMDWETHPSQSVPGNDIFGDSTIETPIDRGTPRLTRPATSLLRRGSVVEDTQATRHSAENSVIAKERPTLRVSRNAKISSKLQEQPKPLDELSNPRLMSNRVEVNEKIVKDERSGSESVSATRNQRSKESKKIVKDEGRDDLSKNSSHHSSGRATTSSAQPVFLPTTSRPGSTRMICFTSIPDSEVVNSLSSMVNELGGTVHDLSENGLDQHVTHMICGKIIRSEKLMSSIARGVWVLVLDYITDSQKVGKWLPEDDYEWSIRPELATFKTREQQLCQSAIWWRKKLSQRRLLDGKEQQGAFSGWRVILYSKEGSSAKLEMITRLIQSGGGDAVSRSELPSAAQYGPTHVLVDQSPLWNVTEMQEVCRAGAKVYKLDYLATFLAKKGIEDESDLHEDFKKWRSNH